MSNVYDIVVIGSGVSGLMCGYKLEKDGYKVLVVEANNIIGGRTRQDFNFTSYPVELGGEMIHGGDTLYYRLAMENKWELFEVFSMDLFNSPINSTYLYLGRERKLIRADQRDEDIQKLADALISLSDEIDNPNREMNLLEHLIKKQVPFRVLGLADAIYSKTWATDLDRIGVKEAAREDSKPNTIPNNYKVQQSSKIMLDHFSKSLDINLNWRVKHIDTTKDEKLIKVTSYNGQVVQAQRVVVTVPLQILKDGDITFTPELPERKKIAIKTIGMDGGMKIIAKFNKKFWLSNCQLVLCGDSPVPQIWMDGPPYRPLVPGQPSEYVSVGFITGDQAKAISALSPQKQIRTFLGQLDAMFGTSENGWTPASDSFISHMVYDWQKNPFVRGAYSYPSIIPSTYPYKNYPNEILAEPIDNKLFFAGEATATTYDLSTINGALETGVRVYEELKTSLPISNKLQSKPKM
ncbi:hypothetical protein ACTFIY_001767 [Dictyostelium cf. discoideum]